MTEMPGPQIKKVVAHIAVIAGDTMTCLICGASTPLTLDPAQREAARETFWDAHRHA